MILAPPLRLGVAALGLEPHACRVGVLGVLKRTEPARERHRLNADLLATLFGRFGGRRAAVNHAAEILGRLSHRLLKVDPLGQLAGLGVHRLELKIALGNLVGIGALDRTHGVDTVGEVNGLVLQLLEVVHVVYLRRRYCRWIPLCL